MFLFKCSLTCFNLGSKTTCWKGIKFAMYILYIIFTLFLVCVKNIKLNNILWFWNYIKLFTCSFNNICFSNAKYLELIAHTKAHNWFCYFTYKKWFDHVFIDLKDWIAKLFTSPRFNKTLVLVKSRVKKYRPRLDNNRTSINQTPGLIFLTYPKNLGFY